MKLELAEVMADPKAPKTTRQQSPWHRSHGYSFGYGVGLADDYRSSLTSLCHARDIRQPREYIRVDAMVSPDWGNQSCICRAAPGDDHGAFGSSYGRRE